MDGNKSVTAVFKQYYVFLPLVRRDPVFVDHFDYSDLNVALTTGKLFQNQALPGSCWIINIVGRHIVVRP